MVQGHHDSRILWLFSAQISFWPTQNWLYLNKTWTCAFLFLFSFPLYKKATVSHLFPINATAFSHKCKSCGASCVTDQCIWFSIWLWGAWALRLQGPEKPESIWLLDLSSGKKQGPKSSKALQLLPKCLPPWVQSKLFPSRWPMGVNEVVMSLSITD